jgi:hypothetical protein
MGTPTITLPVNVVTLLVPENWNPVAAALV